MNEAVSPNPCHLNEPRQIRNLAKTESKTLTLTLLLSTVRYNDYIFTSTVYIKCKTSLVPLSRSNSSTSTFPRICISLSERQPEKDSIMGISELGKWLQRDGGTWNDSFTESDGFKRMGLLTY